MIRIAVDLAGSEQGPAAVLAGARKARAEAPDLEITLVGPRTGLSEPELAEFKYLEAPVAIPMCEKVTRELLRNPDSSLFKIVRLVKEGEADAAVSGGNTACFVALATSMLGTIPGVDRPGIAIFLPKLNGSTILLDAGANTATSAEHLVSYAVMGKLLHQAVFGSREPRIGLLNVGAEEGKGTELCREAYQKLRTRRDINFTGNAEGHDIFSPDLDVVVTDGFTGNCILKAAEGVAEDFSAFLKEQLESSGLAGEPGIRAVYEKFSRRADFAEHSGGFLMGAAGLCVITHGRSGGEAHRRTILRAREAVKQDLRHRLETAF